VTDLGRPRDVTGLTTPGLTTLELVRARRDLAASLALSRPGSPARDLITAHIAAVDTERARCPAGHTGDPGDAAFGQQFLNVPVGQAIPQAPAADRERDHLGREPEASKDRGHARWSHCLSLPPCAIDQRSSAGTGTRRSAASGRSRPCPASRHYTHVTADRLTGTQKQ
jgi:hypothetical protein